MRVNYHVIDGLGTSLFLRFYTLSIGERFDSTLLRLAMQLR